MSAIFNCFAKELLSSQTSDIKALLEGLDIIAGTVSFQPYYNRLVYDWLVGLDITAGTGSFQPYYNRLVYDWLVGLDITAGTGSVRLVGKCVTTCILH